MRPFVNGLGPGLRDALPSIARADQGHAVRRQNSLNFRFVRGGVGVADHHEVHEFSDMGEAPTIAVSHRDRAILKGLLTMHGVTRKVRFRVTMQMVPDEDDQDVADIVVTAKSFINRGDFDMDRLPFLVSNTVELCMRIEATLFKN